MASGEECLICSDNFIVNNKKIKCGFCHNIFHNVCVKMKDNLGKSIAECENILWFCNECMGTVKQNLNLIQKMNSVEKKADTILNQTADCLKALQNVQKMSVAEIKTGEIINSRQQQTKNYAKVLTEGVVVVKPSRACESIETKLKIKQSVDLSELGVGITHMKDAREGAVVVKCRDTVEAKKLKMNLDQNMGKNYSATIPHKKNPRIKIVGIEEAYTENELLRTLKLQNKNILDEASHIKLVIIKKMVKTYLAIIECDAKTFQNILTKAEGRLFVDFRACRCYEYISVIKCYQCNQYNHTAKNCSNVKKCGKCSSSEHETKDCHNTRYSCVNCKLSNERFKLNFPTEHSTFDIRCPTYLRLMEGERSKVQYNIELTK